MAWNNYKSGKKKHYSYKERQSFKAGMRAAKRSRGRRR